MRIDKLKILWYVALTNDSHMIHLSLNYDSLMFHACYVTFRMEPASMKCDVPILGLIDES